MTDNVDVNVADKSELFDEIGHLLDNAKIVLFSEQSSGQKMDYLLSALHADGLVDKIESGRLWRYLFDRINLLHNTNSQRFSMKYTTFLSHIKKWRATNTDIYSSMVLPPELHKSLALLLLQEDQIETQSLKSRNRDLERQIQAIEKQSNEDKIALERFNDMLVPDLKRKLSLLEDELALRKEQHEHALEEHTDVSEYVDRIKTLEHQNYLLDKASESLELQLQDLQEKLSKQISNAEAERTSMFNAHTKAIDKLKKSEDSTSLKLDKATLELATIKIELKGKNKIITSANADNAKLNAKLKDLNLDILAKSNLVTELKNDIKSLNKTIKSDASTINKLQVRIDELTSQAIDYAKRDAVSQGSITALEDSLALAKREAQDNLKQKEVYESSLKQAESQIATLKEHNNELEFKLNQQDLDLSNRGTQSAEATTLLVEKLEKDSLTMNKRIEELNAKLIEAQTIEKLTLQEKKTTLKENNKLQKDIEKLELKLRDLSEKETMNKVQVAKKSMLEMAKEVTTLNKQAIKNKANADD